MKKVVWTGVHQLEYREENAPVTEPTGDEVRLRVAAAGVCGTDVHIIEGKVCFVDPPLVLGHEFAGVVEACGPAAKRFSPGDRVKCDSVIGCGACAWCQSGATQFCASGSEIGITRDGGWAEWLIAPERNLHALPDSIPDEVAAIMDVEVFGAIRKPRIREGDTVAVFGPGPGGLIALQLAKILGAGAVILCGTRPERLALGRRLGADHVVNITSEDPLAAIADLTHGRGVDLAFDAAGTGKSAADCIEAVRPQGKVVFYGVHGAPMNNFPIDRIVLKDMIVYGALSNRTGWETLIDFVASGRLDLHSLITHRFPLGAAMTAFRIAQDRHSGAVKAVLEIHPTARTAEREPEPRSQN